MAKKDKYGFKEAFPRFYKADMELQQKVGTGALEADTVAKAQEYMDKVEVDVSPDIRDDLAKLATLMDEAAKVSYERELFLPAIARHIMNIKSLSGMFNQMMVCRVSAFVLTFLEDVKKLDNDVMDIVGAYHRVVKTLLDLKIKEETNPHGQTFLAELRNATKRYYDKAQAAIGR